MEQFVQGGWETPAMFEADPTKRYYETDPHLSNTKRSAISLARAYQAYFELQQHRFFILYDAKTLTNIIFAVFPYNRFQASDPLSQILVKEAGLVDYDLSTREYTVTLKELSRSQCLRLLTLGFNYLDISLKVLGIGILLPATLRYLSPAMLAVFNQAYQVDQIKPDVLTIEYNILTLTDLPVLVQLAVSHLADYAPILNLKDQLLQAKPSANPIGVILSPDQIDNITFTTFSPGDNVFACNNPVVKHYYHQSDYTDFCQSNYKYRFNDCSNCPVCGIDMNPTLLQVTALE